MTKYEYTLVDDFDEIQEKAAEGWQLHSRYTGTLWIMGRVVEGSESANLSQILDGTLDNVVRNEQFKQDHPDNGNGNGK